MDFRACFQLYRENSVLAGRSKRLGKAMLLPRGGGTLEDLMTKVAYAGEDHGQSQPVGRVNHFWVAN